MIYNVMSYVWRTFFLHPYRAYKKRRNDKSWEEYKEKRGKENPEKTFYIIRRRDWYCGLFSIILTGLVRIDNALKSGYIPIVDMQNSFNIYLPKGMIGKENAWEYYFEQPCGYSLSEVAKSKNVIVGSGAVPQMFPYLNVDFLMGKTGELEYWRTLARKYIRLNERTREILEQEYNKLFDTNDKVLGVKLRGTDYVAGKPKNHPIQPTAYQAVEKAKEIFEEQKCTKVFLSTEDEKIYAVFEKEFGEVLVSNKTDYIQYQGGSMGREEYEQESGGYAAGLEYLMSTLLLARCNCLCAGCVSGTVGALLLTEGYEYTYLFDLGMYGEE